MVKAAAAVNTQIDLPPRVAYDNTQHSEIDYELIELPQCGPRVVML